MDGIWIAATVCLGIIIFLPIWKVNRENESMTRVVELAGDNEQITVEWVTSKLCQYQDAKEARLLQNVSSSYIRQTLIVWYLWFIRVKPHTATVVDRLEWLELKNALHWDEGQQCYFRSTPPYN